MASTTESNTRSADTDFLFEALNYATAPITINVALLGAAKGAKPNTLAKRIGTLAKRYNLSITSTTKGDAVAPNTPSKPTAVAATKTPVSRKRKTLAKVKKDSDEEEAEVEMNGHKSQDEAGQVGKKQRTSNGDKGAHADVDGEENAEEELA